MKCRARRWRRWRKRNYGSYWTSRTWRIAVGPISDIANSPRAADRARIVGEEPRQEAVMPKIDRNGIRIYYEVHGDGPPLLLTHGYSSTSAMWQGQIEALSVGADDAPFLAASDYMAAKIPE